MLGPVFSFLFRLLAHQYRLSMLHFKAPQTKFPGVPSHSPAQRFQTVSHHLCLMVQFTRQLSLGLAGAALPSLLDQEATLATCDLLHTPRLLLLLEISQLADYAVKDVITMASAPCLDVSAMMDLL